MYLKVATLSLAITIKDQPSAAQSYGPIKLRCGHRKHNKCTSSSSSREGLQVVRPLLKFKLLEEDNTAEQTHTIKQFLQQLNETPGGSRIMKVHPSTAKIPVKDTSRGIISLMNFRYLKPASEGLITTQPFHHTNWKIQGVCKRRGQTMGG